MKFVISKDSLINLIASIQNIVGQKPTIPILSNFLIEASNNEIIFTATDLTVGMRCFSEAKVLEEGAITLPAKSFFQLARELTTPNIEMTSYDGQVTELIAGSSKFKLHGMNKSEFPTLPDLSGALQLSLPQKDLRDMLFRTSFAVSREDNRYTLTGLFLQITNSELKLVGSDGKRLAEAKHSLADTSGISGDYIIPLKAVEEIYKTLTDTNDPVKLSLLQNDETDKATIISIETDKATIVTKLISGDYPDFQKLILENPAINVQLHREELISLLKQISLFTGSTTEPINCILCNGELILMANHISIGEGKVSMPVNFSGDRFEIAFNPIYFLDVLRHSKDETVSLALSDPYNPGIITDSSTSRFVLMPMRIKDNL